MRVDNKFENYTILETQLGLGCGLGLRVLPDRLNDAGITPSRPFSCFLIRWACRLDCHSDSSVNGVGSIKLAHRFSSGLGFKSNCNSSPLAPASFRLELLMQNVLIRTCTGFYIDANIVVVLIKLPVRYL